MRWKTESTPRESKPETKPAVADTRARIRAELAARGVESVAADALAEQVERDLDPGCLPSASVLDGVALGFRSQNAIGEALSKSSADLQEIERLMGSFASELSKLDEVLEVLAAQLRRMRSAAPGPASRTVH